MQFDRISDLLSRQKRSGYIHGLQQETLDSGTKFNFAVWDSGHFPVVASFV